MRSYSMFLASLLLAITIKSFSSKFILVEVEQEDDKGLKQEGEACGSIFGLDFDCGRCDEGLFCSAYISPAPPMQCGKCINRKELDRVNEMDLSSKKKEEAIDKGFQCKKEGEGCHNFKKDICCDGLKCFNIPFLPIIGLVGLCRKPVNSGGKCQKEGGLCMGMISCCEGLECTSINPILPIFGIKTCIKPQSKPELKNKEKCGNFNEGCGDGCMDGEVCCTCAPCYRKDMCTKKSCPRSEREVPENCYLNVTLNSVLKEDVPESRAISPECKPKGASCKDHSECCDMHCWKSLFTSPVGRCGAGVLKESVPEARSCKPRLSGCMSRFECCSHLCMNDKCEEWFSGK